MHRLIGALGAAIALQSATALAAAIPSPALSGILSPPATSDYVEASASNTTLLEGEFDAKAYVTKTQEANPDAVQQTMASDGFVDGYWRTWIQDGTQHVLVEIVMAFTGGAGAKRWLGASEAETKADPNYQSSLSITGIETYYGAKFLYTRSHSYGQAVAFVKGNDFFVVIFGSPNDDLGSSAANQAQAQFTAAPAATIPKSQWPETTPAPSRSSTGSTSIFADQPLLFVFAGVLLGLGVVMVIRSLRRSRGA